MTQGTVKAGMPLRESDDSRLGRLALAENGIVLLTTHLYDGVRRLPLDVALYQYAGSLAQGKDDPAFVKKPDLALQLIDQCLQPGYRPIDSTEPRYLYR